MGGEVLALFQIFFIDLTLAGDNAIAVGMAASAVPPEIRRRVIVGGITAAVVLRVLLAFLARRLLGVLGLTLAGGILLLWVAWKLYRETATPKTSGAKSIPKTPRTALLQIIAADLSMSLDNVLAVSGAAVGHPGWVLIGGLALGIAFMAFASALTARLIQRRPWLGYVGLLLIVAVAGRMIWIGSGEVIKAWL